MQSDSKARICAFLSLMLTSACRRAAMHHGDFASQPNMQLPPQRRVVNNECAGRHLTCLHSCSACPLLDKIPLLAFLRFHCDFKLQAQALQALGSEPH